IDPLPADSSRFFGPVPLRIPDGLTREDLSLEAVAETIFYTEKKVVETATFDFPFYIGAEAPVRDLAPRNPYFPQPVPPQDTNGAVDLFTRPTYQSPAPLLTSTRTRITWSPYSDPAPDDLLLATFHTRAIDPHAIVTWEPKITVGLPENAPAISYITECV